MSTSAPTSAPAPAPAPTSAPAVPGRTGRLSAVALGAAMLVVAVVAALGGGASAGDSGRAVVAAGGTQTVAVTLAGMRVSPAVIEVAAGTSLVLEVTNTDAMQHDLVLGTGAQTPMLAGGDTATLETGPVTTAIAGWCSVPGHRVAGMTLDIVVTGTDGERAPSGQPAAGTGHDMGSMGTDGSAGAGTAGSDAADPVVIDPAAEPGPDWRPYDPTLAPAPGATEHVLTMTVRDTLVEVAPGARQTLWTFNGTAPGPTLHGKVGDVFTITFVNDASMGHGIDFHAGSLAPDRPMRTLDAGESLTYQFVATHSGAWLYHCSTMPMALHIANGMFGAVIIDPPGLPAVDTELVLVQSELYLGAQDGTADEAKIAAEEPDAVLFNGYADQYVHAPIQVAVGTRVRVWVVAAGPQRGAAFHVVGAQFDTVFKEGAYLLRPDNPEQGAAQVLDLAAAQGGFVEFVLPEAGHYPFTNHAMVDGERGAHGTFEAS
ncbi:multicopper oxidase domain-containing protein [Pengzhenrongella sicca]|uniref:Copper-containing nitrite reductase n=1 Tax=Pengzhenrongella sicca TaxID=2819238 RepID=A0A8A4ZKB7_9MICO|nr:multicopper oxidase domain-containing protein [Pengzhenrongella sicca]QTE30977.1 multicopper oxidase domain-containing protein [Pengzhenrongella sicca]